MNKNALFCDGTSDYVIPAEPGIHEKVRLRFRTARDDAQEVCLISGGETLQMQKMSSGEVFDYYETEVQLTDTMFVYYFRIKSESEELCYHRCGVSEHPVEYYNFRIMPGFSTPAWAKGAVMYQIFVDRFCNGDPSNDVEDGEYVYIGEPVCKVKDWNEFPAAMDIRRFHGGDLQGVLDKLDYLEELGVEVIYFNPLFVSPSNHKYDIQDYDYIDPHYGVIIEDGGEVLSEGEKDNTRATKYQKRTGDIRNLEASNRLFAKLVEEMHARGMRVILDGVFNHCGSFNKWMDRERIYEPQPEYEKGAYVSAQSPYRDFFHFFDEREEAWPYNKNYDGWWGHDTLPKLNYEDSPTLEEYILNIGKKWVSPPYNADGWRLDVAADLGYSNEYNHIFWENFRKAVKSANPQALILAEHYGDPGEWLQGDEWDSVMNYDAFMEPLTWFLTGMEKHSDEYREGMLGNSDSFIGAMNYHGASFYAPSLYTAMNELSNHDHSRFLTRTNHVVGRVRELGSEAAERNVNKAVLREAVVMQMTWPGAPTIYYGDEAGVCGFTDPDNRRTYPWGREDKELIQFHKDMIRIHKENPSLIKGSLKFIANDYQQLVYGRFTEKEKIMVVINNGNETKNMEISVWELGISRTKIQKFKQLMVTGDFGYSLVKKIHECKGGVLHLEVPSHGAIIVRGILEE